MKLNEFSALTEVSAFIIFNQLFNEHLVNARHALKAITNTSKPVRPRYFKDKDSITEFFIKSLSDIMLSGLPAVACD